MLIVWIIIGILSHVHILITWHLARARRDQLVLLPTAAEGETAKSISTYTEALAWFAAAHAVFRTSHASRD